MNKNDGCRVAMVDSRAVRHAPVDQRMAMTDLGMTGRLTADFSSRPWTIGRIAKEAKVVVVGEVVGIEPAGTPARESNGSSICDLIASIRILRVPKAVAGNAPAVGDVITLWYEGYSSDAPASVLSLEVEGYTFPKLTVGDCFAFPLKSVSVDGVERWQAVDREDKGLLVPCLKTPSKEPAHEPVEDFLTSELANCFARGQYADMYKAACYLAQGGSNSGIAATLRQLIEPQVKNDEKRWVQIAAACLSYFSSSQSKVADLLNGEGQGTDQAALAAVALGHIARVGLEDKIIRATFEHWIPGRWDTVETLNGYSTHPTTVSILKKRLEADDANAIVLTQFLTRFPVRVDKSLAKVAADAAARFLDGHEGDPTILTAAWRLIRDHGSDKQFAVLLREFGRCRTADYARFIVMWQALAYSDSPRSIEVMRIAVLDETSIKVASPNEQWSRDYRICDIAVGLLQRVTKEQFGASTTGDLAERNGALENAKEWLRTH